MLDRKLEAAVSDSPEARWESPDPSPDPAQYPPQQRRLPPTPRQRRMGAQIGIALLVLALLVIVLLDHCGILH